MSAWRLVVRELYERGPLRFEQFLTCADSYRTINHAQKLGLVTRIGRHGKSPAQKYRLTPLGEAFAAGRVACVIRTFGQAGTNGGRMAGTTQTFRPTWVSSLPMPNTIRLQANDCGQRIAA